MMPRTPFPRGLASTSTAGVLALVRAFCIDQYANILIYMSEFFSVQCPRQSWPLHGLADSPPTHPIRDQTTVSDMKTMLLTGILATAFATSALASSGAAESTPVVDLEQGKAKVEGICQACHGADGNGVAAMPVWPKLAGQHPEYIAKQLYNFKNNERYNVQMTPMAMPLTDDDIRNVAAYLATLDQSGGTADAERVKLGESIYRAGNPQSGVPACSGCHGPTGMGANLSKFPRIAGQHSEYTAQTLKHFRATERANDPNGMMRGVAARMTDAEIDAVASYVEGLTQ